MKKRYIKPLLETYSYRAEKGFAYTVGLTDETHVDDYVLIGGESRGIQRATDEFTEYTDATGEYDIGVWTF